MKKTFALYFVLFFLLCGCTMVKNPSTLFYPQPFIYPQAVPFTPEAQYRIQPGDVLNIKFFYNPELNEEALAVRPDGRISLQLVPEIVIAGLTPNEARTLLMQKYEDTEFRDVDVTVQVKTFGVQKVFVDGEVGRAGVIPLVGPMTALQAIAQVYGMRETARTHEVILIRRGVDNKPIVTTLNLDRARDGSDITQDVLLMPYDIVYVPRSPIANIDLWVDQYIRKLLPFTLPSPLPQPTTTSTW
jgi:polysaccharide biosynthesis/export protein